MTLYKGQVSITKFNRVIVTLEAIVTDLQELADLLQQEVNQIRYMHCNREDCKWEEFPSRESYGSITVYEGKVVIHSDFPVKKNFMIYPRTPVEKQK